MNFKDFESGLSNMGYSIVGMNHYYVKGVRNLFVAVIQPATNTSFKSEGTESDKAFSDIWSQILDHSKA